MRRLLALTFLLLPAAAAAGGGPGTEASPLLKLGPGARPAALAEAFVGVAEEADASAWNPAGLAFLPRPAATLMYLRLHEQVHYNYLAYGMPWRDRFGFGAHLVYAKTDDMTRTFEDPGGNLDATKGGDKFSSSNLKLALSGAYKALPWLSAGGNLSVIRDSVAGESNGGVLFDLAALARPPGRFAYGLALQNLGTAKGGSAPTLLRLGSSARFERRGLLTAELDRGLASGDTAFAFGGEWLAMPLLALRLGYRFGASRDAGGRRVSVGFGFRVQNVGFDYAVVPFGALGLSQRASLSYSFSGPSAASPAGAAAEERPGQPDRKDPDELLAQAERLLGRRRYDDARVAFEAAARELAQADERHVRILERVGQAQFQLGRPAEAKDTFMRALRKAKDLGVTPTAVGDAYAGLGLCLIKEGNLKYARKLFERALETSPSPGTRRMVEIELEKLDRADK